MPHSSRITLWLAFLALVTPALLPASTKTARKPAGKKAIVQPVEAPRPPLPQELPPVAPTVTYRGGQLTIVAPNSTLFDILAAVRSATGAAVDAPAASAGERVATRLGPGRPREVLTALLDGSHFNYILLGSSRDPGEVRRLILTSRSGGSAAAAGSESPPREMVSRPAARPVPPSTSEEEGASPEESVEPAEEAPPEPQAEPPQPPEVKSPEQIQEELRQHEEQQRQQRQQQPQPEQPPE